MRSRISNAERIFIAGGKVPVPVGNGLATVGGQLAGRLPLPGIRQWRANVDHVVGRTLDGPTTRRMVRHWAMNNLWSMSLGSWSDDEVLRRVIVTEEHADRLHESVAGPGLVLALPHMGSWDFAGAWCARVGIKVVSVAERLPRGLFERFKAAREAMGMDIHPMRQPDLMRLLADDVEAGRMVCLLADRDLSSHGLQVTWPTGAVTTMPPGPALLASRTGADLRVVTTHFEGARVRIDVSETVDQSGGVAATTQRLAEHFAFAIAQDPANWLVLQPLVR